MVLIDNHLADLVIGYDKIRDAETRLRSEWRGRLYAAYAHRHDKYLSAVSAREQQWSNSWPMLRAGILASVGLFSAGLLAVIAALISDPSSPARALISIGFAFALVGFISMDALLAYWSWQKIITKPKPPQHPRDANLFVPLLPQWLEQFKGNLPDQLPYEGARGEFAFIEQLRALDADSAFIAYRLQQRPGDDLDVTLVGPKGVWLFEVKYWSGTISWRDGKWRHWKNFHRPGGVPDVEEKQVDQPPDQQWLRNANDVIKTLRLCDPGLLLDLGSASPVRGGLVFAHQNATYDIPRDPPFRWGKIGGWLKEVQASPLISSLDERSRLRLLDALLARHHAVSDDKETRSMNAYADRLIHQTEERLAQWAG